MKLCISFLTILFVSVNSDEWGLVHFTLTEDSLRECLQTSSSWNPNTDPSVRKIVAEFLTPLFTGTKTVEFINDRVSSVITNLYRRGKIDSINNQNLTETMKKVIEDCSDQRHYTELPHFSRPDGLEPLLNLILVNWQPSLRTLLGTRNGRSLLRSYSEQALSHLESYYSTNYRGFESVLQIQWLEMARVFWDARNQFHPYVNYTYSVDKIYTRDDREELMHRRSEDLALRDPPASNAEMDMVLDILEISHNFNGLDSVSHYRTHGMTSSEYYLEIHLIQFYQVLFLYLEMMERGIDNERDTWDGSVPNNVFPESVQGIGYNLRTYWDYLLSAVIEISDGYDFEDVPRQNYAWWTRFREANMILDRWMRLRRRNIMITSTTPEYTRGEVEELVLKGENCFSTNSRDDSSNTDKPSCSRYINLNATTNDEYYGYTISKTDNTQEQ